MDISIVFTELLERIPILQFKPLSMKIQKRERFNTFNLLLFNINKPVLSMPDENLKMVEVFKVGLVILLS